MVFQNPYASLNPRQRVGDALAEPLRLFGRDNASERRDAACAMLQRVGLDAAHAHRFPHMFSGGQRQRIAIARALMLRPALVIADEPASALDVSVRAQVLNLMQELGEAFDIAYVFISHDLDVVRHFADELLVMYLGRCVESGAAAQVLDAPLHPYTRALVAATPRLHRDPARPVLGGEPPSPLQPPAGCAFHPRCPHAQPRCRAERPVLRLLDARLVACHRADEIARGVLG
jgi:dipeptide transport system ATP-binding protein